MVELVDLAEVNKRNLRRIYFFPSLPSRRDVHGINTVTLMEGMRTRETELADLGVRK